MSHKQWEDLIPFYVAHTLPPDQAAALGQHIATCDYCQQVLEDWRGIAAATRVAVEDWTHDIPPLSAQVRAS
ncbi:MAG: zf-HC2 domain-containing protein, partial [Anaerolineae bacterium]|nr:zf-HC2 domain-containing protein [Anaerolineae bacterium]